MAEIYNFDLTKQLMAKDNGGEWVRYSDYAFLAAENERLRKALKEILNLSERPYDKRNGVTVSRSMLARIADEIDALRAASPVSEAEQRIASLEAALRMPDADRRLWFISDCLARHLHFNRSDICKAFGVSVPQASKDIKRWLELHPGAVTYNKSSKRYEAALPAVPSKGEQAMGAALKAAMNTGGSDA